MSNTHRIKIKIGDAEFDAEGTPEDVKAQYEAFLDLIKSVPVTAKPAQKPDEKAAGGAAITIEDDISDEDLLRIFSKDEAGRISLKVLPSGENANADALLALLYGYRRLAKTENVFGATLAVAATKSGVQYERIDRTLDIHKAYWKRGGFKRGATYTLNNQGVLQGAKIAKTLLE